MEAGGLAKWHLVHIDSDESVEKALSKMNSSNIHHIFVKDAGGPKAVVSQSELVSHLMDSPDKNKALKQPMSSLKLRPIKSFSPDIQLGEAISEIKNSGCESIVIKTSDNTFGIITIRDIVSIFENSIEKGLTKDTAVELSATEITLANPLAQNLMKLFSDLGI